MRDTFLNIYRRIVGNEVGWSGEGNEQWYYFLALVMNCMLVWMLEPRFGALFTIMAILHFITVCVYGYMMMDLGSVWLSVVYFFIHAVMFVICLAVDFWWAIITASIVIVAYLIAPDCMGNNIFMPYKEDQRIFFGNDNTFGILAFHTVWFALFVVITLCLPTALWIRIVIIIVCMILHPIIDFFEGECILISDVTQGAFYKIIEYIREEDEEE